MKKTLLLLLALCLVTFAFSQSYLDPAKGYKLHDLFPSYNQFSNFEVSDSIMYANDGDTIRCFNLKTGKLLTKKYGKPGSYMAWPSFLTISPDGKRLWAGYTNGGNTDDRIYAIDLKTGTWALKAKLSGNFDLEFLNGKVLVSGLNSSDWSAANSIFLLDTTGSDNHKKLIEIGGNSTGFAVDSKGNVYCGTSLMYAATPKPDGLYSWNSDKVLTAISGTTFLTLDDGTVLSNLPNGGYDCRVDAGDNLFFNSNNFSGPGVIGRWNGLYGPALNYDTVATAPKSDWMTSLKSTGNVLKPEKGGKLFTMGYALPVVEIQHTQPPVNKKKMANIEGLLSDAKIIIDLSSHFSTDDANVLTYEVVSNSNSSVALAFVDNKNLEINFVAPGQTRISVKATSFGLSVADTFYVGVHPDINGDYVVSDFENLSLDPNSYWNGSDGSGGFVSGAAKFHNSNSGFTWDGWAYSNMADNTTASWSNQYSAITGAGVDTLQSKGKNYGVGYISSDWNTYKPIPLVLNFQKKVAQEVKGLFVTNSTYAALSMEKGDDFAKKFGGVDGNDPDWYKLSVWGLKNGNKTDTINFYLADYRFSDNSKDYVINTWQWLELSSLGSVDSLMFSVSSSDVGMFGINTPLYFNVDNIYMSPDNAPVVNNPIADVSVNVNAPDYTIDLTNVFADADKDEIVKTVESNSNTALVTTSIQGNILTLAFTPNQTGTAAIVIKGQSGLLSVTDTFTVTLTPNTGVNKTVNTPFILFPNPSDGRFRITVATNKSLKISVIDLSGHVVYVNPNYKTGELIDISSMPSGNYVVRLQQDQETNSRIIIKQ